MEYVMLTLLIVITILLIAVLLRKNNNTETDEKISKLEINVIMTLTLEQVGSSLKYIKLKSQWWI